MKNIKLDWLLIPYTHSFNMNMKRIAFQESINIFFIRFHVTHILRGNYFGVYLQASFDLLIN